MKQFSLLTLLLPISLLLYGQSDIDHRVSNEIIIQLEQKTDINNWLQNSKSAAPSMAILSHKKKMGIRHNIHLLSFDEKNVENLTDFLQKIQTRNKVLSAQFNYRIQSRNTPNDTHWPQQWDMDIINAPQAWEITTGGQTAKGTRIVVANMDSGFEFNHADLKDNLWHNPAEIIGDGIDNDNNGYIDDEIGWDYYTDSPNIVPGNHGTSTAGIIGATGDNAIGVTGVNWDVDLMLFSFPNLISDLIMAYEYIIDQRMRFNESQGNQGAFVVVANASFGSDFTCCEQQPTWAAMFDLLGEVGILTSSGVANSPFNVDELCDMPATCTSEYLVISCNTDMDDNLDQTSAYGPVSVDFGSPGGQSFTTKASNTYGGFGGNSAATPHVTGAIALLYSAPFEGLEEMAISHPQQTALSIRDYLISTVDPLPSMEGMTVSGGRLNLGKGMEALVADNSNILGDLEVSVLYPNPTSDGLTVNFKTPENGEYLAEVYNAIGQIITRQTVNVGETGRRTFFVDTDQLPEGVYVLNFGKNDTWIPNKFVVTR